MREEDYIQIVPSKRQFMHQQLEFYGFFHFSMNTFTNCEWGDGTESEDTFCPEKIDAIQWVTTIKEAGMRGVILTCKHHDGFCLWPSKYTKHSVANSPYKNGKGDVVREVSEACQKAGLLFGVYLSPWDRNQSTYGYGESYNDYFVNQLTELLTEYGDVFCVWFDGACGEGSNGKKQNYDWNRYYEVVRRLQPNACISICGPDIRWIGNEGGHTRASEWSVVSKRLLLAEKIQENSQKSVNEDMKLQPIKNTQQDLGSREALSCEEQLVWYPAELDISIRPGWFYHKNEDTQVLSFERLKEVYLKSVGGNSMLLLNVPPNKEGVLAEADCMRLKELGTFLKTAFQSNLLVNAIVTASDCENGHEIGMALEAGYENYYKAPDGKCDVTITIKLATVQSLNYLVLQENILLSQRIEAFHVSLLQGGKEVFASSHTVVGYKKIVCLNGVNADVVRIELTQARVCPTLAFLGLY